MNGVIPIGKTIATMISRPMNSTAPKEFRTDIVNVPVLSRPRTAATLRDAILAEIDATITAHQDGKPGRIRMKMNSLVDRRCIAELYRASQAGVPVELNIRGICCLRPGVPGLSENIRVKSIVGRFLEHSRIYAFGNGSRMPSRHSLVFISSADWMGRNMFRRIEVAWPVRDAALRQRVIDECLVPYLLDTQDALTQGSDGRYEPVVPADGVPGISAQKALMRLHRTARDAAL